MHLTLLECPASRFALPPHLLSDSPATAAPVAAQETSAATALHAPLYDRLANHLPSMEERAQAATFLRTVLDEVAHDADELPEDPQQLTAWMEANIANVHAQYQSYLESRKAGAPRRYFLNRAHALYFLRQVAPTKLVDGSWLYGLCAHGSNARLSDLITTYVEELGDGQADKNHVKLYRTLLARHGLDPVDDLEDPLYRQGLVQLALGWNAEEFLPEVVGFNLGYEQLPLHLLITAYELNELGIDPYYFTLHVTVDNADTGHAKRACVAALEAAPRIDDGGEYWRRVRAGAKLGNTGLSTLDVIHGFDIDSEVITILARKASSGHGAHSDFCKVAGRSVNDWLANADDVPAFLAALEQGGWIKRNQPAQDSRFWRLLQGDRAEMFGVFSPYELQVIHDWIRGPASVDGAPFDAGAALGGTARQMSFRVAQRLQAARRPRADAGSAAVPSSAALDTDLEIFEQRYPTLSATEQQAMLVQAMAPALHWTPVGLLATRMFLNRG
ncbi:iron-containing redox enzyme family protein [Acidovorax sp.]|uniref:iron-containing redox enzyme family protein n=1 Tax=Acidovorax sp. TaxID=1872122 RepID=UPI00391BD981